jgi:hypothetical protein
MRSAAALLLSILAFSQPLAAQDIVYEEVIYVDSGVEAGIGTAVESADFDAPGSERFVYTQQAQAPAGIATYGPFRVLDATHAALVDVTDTASPRQFAALLRDYPGIATLSMVDCPGTEDDRANLRVGAMIRDSGIATDVPEGGFVASGAVELFLAGVRRSAASSAEFAVHSWADEDGREAGDYPADAPENRAYIDYYRHMGMTAPEATAFYAMTNSVPFAQALRLTASDIGRWVPLDRAVPFIAVETAVALAPEPERRETAPFGGVTATLADAILLDSGNRLN